MKPENRIKFALAFAEKDLERVFKRPETEASFRSDFSAFLCGSRGDSESLADRGGILAMPNLEFVNWELAEFRALQDKCRPFVSACIHRAPWSAFVSLPSLTLTADYGFLRLSAGDIPVIQGDAGDVFMIVLWHLINGPAGEHISKCPEPKCQKVFFRPTKRAVYCSPTCSTRARVRRLRAGAAKPRQKTVVKIVGKFPEKRREIRGNKGKK